MAFDDFRVSLGVELSKDINIQSELNKIKGLHLNIDSVTINKAAIDSVRSVLSNSNLKLDLGLDTRNTIQQAQRSADQVSKIINGTIQKNNTGQIIDFSKSNNAAKEAQSHFKTLSNTIKEVSVVENFGLNKELTSFVVTCREANGIVEQLRYSLKDLKDVEGNKIGSAFQYTGGTINDNGVIQQITKISSKADDLAIKLEKVRSAYSDINAPKAIKGSEHVTELAKQYSKVESAINAVRQSDSATFTGMVSNANREIAVLEGLVSQFKNAEYAATSLRTKDIATIKIDEGNNLNAFVDKMKQSGHYTVELQNQVAVLRSQLAKVFDSNSLAEYLNRLSNLQSEFKAVNAASATAEKATKLQTNIDMELNKLRNWKSQLQESGQLSDELARKFQKLETSLSQVGTQTGLTTWRADLKSLESDVKRYSSELKAAAAHEQLLADKARVLSNIDRILAQNTAMTKTLRSEFTKLRVAVDGCDDTNALRNLKLQMSQLNNEMKASGKFGLSRLGQIKDNIQKFSSWFFIGGTVATGVRLIRSFISTIYALDTALVDLRKTTSATSKELEDFYYASNVTAKNLGVTTEEIISQASAWSRLGYSIEDAKTMAENSAIFKSISPGMDIKKSTDGLVSTMKAFKIEADESLDGIISKINIIGNTQAVDNQDIVDILTRSSSAMAEANNNLEQTIALGTAA